MNNLAKVTVTLGLTLVIGSHEAAAAQCENIIAFSRLAASDVRSEQDFKQQAGSFCKSYTASRQASNAGGGTLGYNGFSIGGNYSSANARFSAEQICSSSAADSLRSDAYRTYVETIAPGAYGAYEKCINAKLDIEFGQPSVLATEVEVSVSFLPKNRGQTAALTASAIGGAKCEWLDAVDPKLLGSRVVMDKPGKVRLRCTRPNAAEPSTITIYDANSSGMDSEMRLSWDAFRDGRTIGQFEQLAKRQMEMDEALRSAVLAVRSSSCPIGFKPWQDAQGRFLRGIDPTGLIDPAGVRQPGSLQGADVQPHRHAYVAPANRTGNPSEAMDSTPTSEASQDRRNYWRGNRNAQQNANTLNSTGGETRPVNVAVTFCIIA